ncbi:hypothetical protein B0J12DRAFT_655902 [Macrophomina phaseolina]|uniref:Secreted protein n=1 Tax=Macrophomina phaseolina TaxID=35725 RepID=A0ABQ8GH91_9PEZI|nr:hypothetical protein B0J12DRAFT_655902 [Macrophomina phaseolina]
MLLRMVVGTVARPVVLAAAADAPALPHAPVVPLVGDALARRRARALAGGAGPPAGREVDRVRLVLECGGRGVSLMVEGDGLLEVVDHLLLLGLWRDSVVVLEDVVRLLLRGVVG